MAELLVVAVGVLVLVTLALEDTFPPPLAGNPLAQRGQVSNNVFHSLVRRLNRWRRMAGWRGQVPSLDMVLVPLCFLERIIYFGCLEGGYYVGMAEERDESNTNNWRSLHFIEENTQKRGGLLRFSCHRGI